MKSEILKPLGIIYDYRRGEKWIRGMNINKVGTVIYKVKFCNEIYEKHTDQLSFYRDNETKLEVLDTSQAEQDF